MQNDETLSIDSMRNYEAVFMSSRRRCAPFFEIINTVHIYKRDLKDHAASY